MSDHTATIANRYAQALYDWLADQPTVLEAVQQDLRTLAAWLDESPEFRALIHDAVVQPERASQALSELLSDRAREETLRFLRFLIVKRRINALAAVAARFDQRVDDARGIASGELVSVAPLTDEQQTILTTKLGKRLGRTLHLKTRQDPTLIGGFRVRVRDQIMDHSVRTMLDTFRRKLLSAGEETTYGH